VLQLRRHIVDEQPGIVGRTPSLLRAINERAVLDAIRRLAPISRAQVAREVGLSKPTVSQTLAGLEQANLVREIGRSSGHVGATGTLYELNANAGWVVGVDVGRSWVRAGIADLMGMVVARRYERAKTRSSASLIAQVGDIAHGLASEAGLDWTDVTQAVVGSPGVFDAAQQRVAMAANLPGWERRGLVEAVRAELGTNVAFHNDTNLAALGEQWAGIARDVQDFVYVSIGTGVGMGIVVRGELYEGAGGSAGEIAYLPLAGDPTSAAAKRVGTFEAAAGSSAVVRRAQELGMPAPRSARRVFQEARDGNPIAVEVVEREAENIALLLAVVSSVLDPELVILGGGLGANPETLLEPVRKHLKKISPFIPRIEVSELGDEAVLQGALATALATARNELLSKARSSRVAAAATNVSLHDESLGVVRRVDRLAQKENGAARRTERTVRASGVRELGRNKKR
jgi:predicted NBD/HSP70 family sugar kinase